MFGYGKYGLVTAPAIGPVCGGRAVGTGMGGPDTGACVLVPRGPLSMTLTCETVKAWFRQRNSHHHKPTKKNQNEITKLEKNHTHKVDQRLRLCSVIG
jgi:hypothetical protein